MNKKQIIILSIILAVLALGLAFKFLIQRTDTDAATEVYASLPFPFNPASVEEIRIGRGPKAASVDLAKQNGQWVIRSLWDAKADVEKVNGLLDAVSHAKGELRGAQQVFFEDFGIGDADAFFLKFNGPSGTPVLDLRVGSHRAGKDGFFVRKKDSPEVYLVEAPFDNLLGIFMAFEEAIPPSNFWADLKLFTLNPEDIKKIEISHFKNGKYNLIAGVESLDDKEGWKLIGSFSEGEIDPEKVVRYIATLNSVQAKAVLDPKGTDYDLEEPVWRLEVITGDNDQELILEAGPEETKESIYIVKFVGSPLVFGLAAHFFEDLDIKNENFLKRNPEPSTESNPVS